MSSSPANISLFELSKGRDNNFNLIRFIAACMVVYEHCFSLIYASHDKEPLQTLLGFSIGEIAVDVFFFTSGFLIAGSFFRRKSTIAFFWARILRIYPALCVSLVVVTITIGLTSTTVSIIDFFTNSQTYNFVFRKFTNF